MRKPKSLETLSEQMAYLDGFDSGQKEMQAEINEIKAEVERLKKYEEAYLVKKRMKEATAQVFEELRALGPAELQKRIDAQTGTTLSPRDFINHEVEDLKAEVERLREALTHYAKPEFWGQFKLACYNATSVDALVKTQGLIARKALGEE